MAQSQCHPRADWLLSEARAVLPLLRGEMTNSADHVALSGPKCRPRVSDVAFARVNDLLDCVRWAETKREARTRDARAERYHPNRTEGPSIPAARHPASPLA